MQALRDGTKTRRLADLVGLRDVEGYSKRRSALGALFRRVRRILDAAAYVLLDGGNGEQGRHDRAGAAEPESEPAERKSAYERLARERFGGLQPDDQALIESLRAGSGPMIEIAGQISAYLDHLENIDQGDCDLDHRFRSDIDIFRQQLRNIYREHLDDRTVQSADRQTAGAGTTDI